MKVVYHPGTETYMALNECVIVDVPSELENVEDIEEYLRDNHA